MAKKNPIQAVQDLIGHVEPMKATKEIAQPGTPGTELTDTPVTPIDPMARPLWEIYDFIDNPFKEFDDEPTWATINGKGAFYKNGLVAFSAKEKQGKSLSTYAILMALLKNERFDTLELVEQPKLVVIFDTEMGERTRIRRQRKIQETLGENGKRFLVVSLLHTAIEDMMKRVDEIVSLLNPDIITIDQIGDFVDINNSAEVRVVEKWLKQMADKRTIFTVIHQNKSAESKKMNGHMGSALGRAATEIYDVQKKPGYFEVIEILNREESTDGDKDNCFRFSLDSEGYIVEPSETAMQKEVDRLCKNYQELKSTIQEIVKPGEELTNAEIVSRYMAKTGRGRSTAINKINEAVKSNFLIKLEEGKSTIYSLAKGVCPN